MSRLARSGRATARALRMTGVAAAALVLVFSTGVAGAEPGDNGKGLGGEKSSAAPAQSAQGKPSSDTSSPQPPSNADYSGNGANVHGPYDSTRDGSASQNGKGDGKAKGKPCAGCVGKADNKNPKGQLPGGSDPNSGYECDKNNGVGKGNPAHTSCVEQPPTTVPPTTVPPTTPPTSVPPTTSTPPTVTTPPTTGSTPPATPPSNRPPAGGKTPPGLASTGVNLGLPLGAGLAALAAGLGLLLTGRRLQRR